MNHFVLIGNLSQSIAMLLIYFVPYLFSDQVIKEYEGATKLQVVCLFMSKMRQTYICLLDTPSACKTLSCERVIGKLVVLCCCCRSLCLGDGADVFL